MEELPSNPPPSDPPLADRRQIGAADFYFVINATFRFIEKERGPKGLRRWWQDLGTHYYAPVSQAWQQGGLPAVARYWRAFFQAEPGADVRVETTPTRVTLDVRVCPAIRHLRAHGREIARCFCEHCYYVSEAIAAPAGLTVRVEGGAGACRQSFLHRDAAAAPQDMAQIREAT